MMHYSNGEPSKTIRDALLLFSRALVLSFFFLSSLSSCGLNSLFPESNDQPNAIPRNDLVNTKTQAIKQADSVLLDYAKRIGLEVTGYPLTEAYQAGDGKIEKIFENVVLVINEDTSIGFRPVPKIAGIPAETPGGPTDQEGMVFVNTQGELGFSVPIFFVEFIQLHGSLEVIGKPLTEVHELDNSILQQCFEHVCLAYNPNSPDEQHLQIVHLGYAYKDSLLGGTNYSIVNQPLEDEVRLQVWVRYASLSPNQSQEINLSLIANALELSKIKATAIVSMPDGTLLKQDFSPIDARGQSTVSLAPIRAENGTKIRYQVCLSGLSENDICVMKSFLVWSSP